MAKQANTTMIGGFVVIAFMLLAASVVILGSGKLFKKTETFVLYFDSSIKGLNVGAPVLIQGVQVGSVANIMIRTNRRDLTMNIPVLIEIELDRFHVDHAELAPRNPAETIAELSDRGLRAVLGIQSLITGQLMIELDYYPDTPTDLKRLTTEYTEIPTIPSTTERLLENLQEIDLTHIENIITGVDRLVNNPDLPEMLHALRQTADESQEFIGKFDRRIDGLIDAVELTLGDARGFIDESQKLVGKLDRRIDGLIDAADLTLDDARGFIDNTNGQMEPLVDDLRLLIRHFDEMAQNLDKQVDGVAANLNDSLAGVRGVVSEDAPLVLQLEETLESITNMTQSIRQLANYLEQHPESLLRGKDSF